ncbi:hypothetical protein SHIRM173S_13063 [Streptomyces hirsutus]
MLSGVDPVLLVLHARPLGLAEDAGEADGGDRTAVGQQVPEHFARADAGQLVDVLDEEEVRARGHRLDQLVGQQQIEHGRLVDHHQVGVQLRVFWL